MKYPDFTNHCFATAEKKEKTILKWLLAQTAFKYDGRTRKFRVVLAHYDSPRSRQTECDVLLDRLDQIFQDILKSCDKGGDLPIGDWLKQLRKSRGENGDWENGNHQSHNHEGQTGSHLYENCLGLITNGLRNSLGQMRDRGESRIDVRDILSKVKDCMKGQQMEGLELLNSDNWMPHYSECEFYDSTGRRMEIHARDVLANLKGRQIDFAPLGFFCSDGEVHLSLWHIWHAAMKLQVNPEILFEIVMVHELAHAIHCFGLDADGRPWRHWDADSQHSGVNYWEDDFERSEILEGLAEWYVWEYVNEKDTDECDVKYRDAMLRSCAVADDVYSVFAEWDDKNKEQIRKAMVEARRFQPGSAGLSRRQFESWM